MENMEDAEPKYTVVGGGAIGGTLAAHLSAGGHTVQIIDADTDHVHAINNSGLRITTPSDTLSARVPAYTLDDAPATLSRVLLAVKAQATDTAVRWIAPRLAANGYVASMQNGLNEATIAAQVGDERTVSAFVDLFADVVAPGVVKDGGFGTIALGEYTGGVSARVRELAGDLRHWGTPILTSNVDGFLWSKTAFGAMLTATSFVDADMADVIKDHRSSMLALAREVFAVADACGLTLESFDAFSPDDYRVGAADDQTLVAFEYLEKWLRGQTKTRSGIWRDLNVRHRATEVPTQYARVFTLADQHGIATPRLHAMVDVIRHLEKDVSISGPHLFERMDKEQNGQAKSRAEEQ